MGGVSTDRADSHQSAAGEALNPHSHYYILWTGREDVSVQAEGGQTELLDSQLKQPLSPTFGKKKTLAHCSDNNIFSAGG